MADATRMTLEELLSGTPDEVRAKLQASAGDERSLQMLLEKRGDVMPMMAAPAVPGVSLADILREFFLNQTPRYPAQRLGYPARVAPSVGGVRG